jgi:hypothetical protein
MIKYTVGWCAIAEKKRYRFFAFQPRNDQKLFVSGLVRVVLQSIRWASLDQFRYGFRGSDRQYIHYT